MTFVLGGARSGKSLYAEQIVAALPPPWVYIATAQALDEEMRVRIRMHQERRGADWHTIEAPLDLADALRKAASRPALVDCLTLWLTNLMLGGHDVAVATHSLDHALDARTTPTVLVANELGMGIVPDNALARAFRNEAGRLNQRIAARAEAVLLMVAGLAMKVK